MCGYESIKPMYHPEVRKELAKRRKAMVKRAEVTEDMIVEKLSTLAFTDIGDALLIDGEEIGWDYDKLKRIPALRSILNNVKIESYTEGRGPNSKQVKRIQFQTKDQLRALELLMKYMGMLTEKVEVVGEVALIDRLNKGRERLNRDSGPIDEDTEEQNIV
jgi:hypothetical protein